MYLSGHDKNFRPVIVMNAHEINLKYVKFFIKTKKFTGEEILSALVCLFDVLTHNILVGGKIENWILIMETNQLGLFGFPWKAFENIVSCLQNNFVGRLEKMFVLNPSYLF